MSNVLALVSRLVDDDEKDVKLGEAGEAWLKGPMITKGYHNNAEADKSSFTHDGWFKTGDILRVEKDQLYIVDRKKVSLDAWTRSADYCTYKYTNFHTGTHQVQGSSSRPRRARRYSHCSSRCHGRRCHRH